MYKMAMSDDDENRKDFKGRKRENTHSRQPFCNKWWIFALIAIVIGGILFIVLGVTLPSANGPANTDYGIILDAGSSHTEMFIYSWPSAKLNDTGEIHEIFRKECSKKGISEYPNDLNKVESIIKECLDKAKEQIPESRQARAPVFLGATAGMRLLNAYNSSQSDGIFKKIKETIMQYPFQFKDAKIISGEEEGAGAWITVNYILQTLLKHSSTLGAMDLGGASTQIAFQPLNSSSESQTLLNLHLFGWDYPLYAHSFLCYGKNEIERRYVAMIVKDAGFINGTVSDPCAPLDSTYERKADMLFGQVCTSSKYAKHAWGSDLSPESNLDPNKVYTLRGAAAPKVCEEKVNKMFNFTCTASTCSYNNVYQPKVEGHFMAFSAFYHVMNLFNQTTEKNLTLLVNSLANYCKKTWKEVEPPTTENNERIKFQCFDGWYIKDMLTKGYGFTENTWPNINFQNKVNGQSTGWTTGIMLNLTNSVPAQVVDNSPVNSPTFIPLVICGSIFVLVAIIFAVYAFYVYKRPKSIDMA